MFFPALFCSSSRGKLPVLSIRRNPVRHPAIEVDNALEMAEQTDVRPFYGWVAIVPQQAAIEPFDLLEPIVFKIHATPVSELSSYCGAIRSN